MKITYIKTKGFRKFKGEFETKLYDITTITGGNRKGKTNILYAIIWAFFGTNLTGDDKVWLGNKKSDNCYVELGFIDNQGKEHTLIRYKNKYDNKMNYILLDNRKVKPEDLQTFTNDKKLFLSILNPNYFINKKPVEQKKLLDDYLPKLDISIVYNKLEDSEKKYLEGIPNNIMEYLKELNNNKKMYEDKIKNFQGKIEYAENIINEMVVEEKRIFEKEEELSLARQELSFLTTNTESISKKKQQQIVDNLNIQISQIGKQIEDLTTEMTTGKKIYLSIKSKPVAHCPMCNQEIKEENRLTTINNMKRDLEESFNKKIKLEESLSELKSKFIVEKCKLYALGENSNIDKEKQISIVQEQIKRLEQEQIEIEKYNNSIIVKQNNINAAKQDIIIFKQKILEYENMIENIKQTKNITEKLLINYIEEKMKFATKHLKDVKIKYYSILKETGEIKEDFIITYKNNNLSDLSRSEIIAVSLEFANMFNKISNVNLPIFVDDYESCADYDFITQYSKDTQVIISKVEKSQLLKIANYNKLDNCKIIKPNIKGFKTLNTYRRNVTNIKKVA